MIKPYVQAALLCEKVIKHDDGKVTLVGITDKFDAALMESDGEELHFVETNLYFEVRSGDLVGKHELRLEAVTADGEPVTSEKPVFPAVFEGGQSGVHIHVELGFPVVDPGGYRFDVYLDDADEPITRLPLQVRFEPHA